MGENIRIGIIGGTGVGEALRDEMNPGNVEWHDIDTPFGKSSAPVITGTFHDVLIAIISRHGEGHVLSPSAVPSRANIFALKQLGCTHLVASGATGSLRENIHPGDLVICDQLIDKTTHRARTFYEHAAVHVEFSEPFCPIMRQWLLTAAKSLREFTVHDHGCYVCMEGPGFSTKAECEMHRQWGGDLIGMTALPEARLAREAEIAYALIALPTDYDCWRARRHGVNEKSLLEEVIGNLNRATKASIALIKAALNDVTLLRERLSPAHDALRLAIWSDKSKIDPTEIDRLRVLWGKYFH